MRRTTQGTLLTFTGFHDPYSEGPVEGSRQPGPILSLLGERTFDRVVLFSTPSTVEVTRNTLEAIREECPETRAEIRHLELPDPTDYSAILRELRSALRDLTGFDSRELYVATASGTPQMHACWMLLVTSGEFRARLLHVRPPRFVSRDTPMVSEVDLSEPEFPTSMLSRQLPSDTALFDLADEPELQERAHSLPRLARRRVDEFIEAATPVEPDFSVIFEEAGIVGDDPGMIRALSRAVTVAPYDEPVLIFGENGTGKELIARLIHRMSHRSGGPLVSSTAPPFPRTWLRASSSATRRGPSPVRSRTKRGSSGWPTVGLCSSTRLESCLRPSRQSS